MNEAETWAQRNPEAVARASRKYHAKRVATVRIRRAKEAVVSSMPGEVWAPIPGWEGMYEVSDAGRVRSLTRMVNMPSGGQRQVIGRVLCQGTNTGGYPQVVLSRDSRSFTHLVHRIVLAAFVGPCPDGLEACHNDGDQTNNVPSNLRWDTHPENNRDRHRHGTYKRRGNR